jgi:leucyl aminopeptidase
VGVNAADIIQPDKKNPKAVNVACLDPSSLAAFVKKLTPAQKNLVAASDFKAQAGAHLFLTNDNGVETVLFGLGAKGSPERTPFLPGSLASILPDGIYRLRGTDDARLAALAFALESYRFVKYRSKALAKKPVLLFGNKKQADEVNAIAQAVFRARDLINTPANDLGPDELEKAVLTAGKAFRAKVKTIKGTELKKGFPLIAAVGMGSERAPRLVDLRWGNPSHKRITLVGKGVVFDTGGLDIKPSSNMLLMKKDMGGAACALALAELAMGAKLKVRLRLLIPIVENSISGISFRPGDIFKSRKGLSVEIGNTDAEGRLILADALAYACEENPDLLIDMATLTGAARVALGPDLPPFYTEDEGLARELEKFSVREFDPLWRLPLHRRYASMLKSKSADLNNVANNSFAGSVIAALFLAAFVDVKSWLHLDIYAWNPSSTPGRPEGGEAQGVHTLFALLKNRYGRKK